MPRVDAAENKVSRDNSSQAFPKNGRHDTRGSVVEEAQSGMLLRDYFAAKAMQALIADHMDGRMSRTETALESYYYADEMMVARERK